MSGKASLPNMTQTQNKFGFNPTYTMFDSLSLAFFEAKTLTKKPTW